MRQRRGTGVHSKRLQKDFVLEVSEMTFPQRKIFRYFYEVCQKVLAPCYFLRETLHFRSLPGHFCGNIPKQLRKPTLFQKSVQATLSFMGILKDRFVKTLSGLRQWRYLSSHKDGSIAFINKNLFRGLKVGNYIGKIKKNQ